MSEWLPMKTFPGPLGTRALFWREGWQEPQVLEWKHNSRLVGQPDFQDVYAGIEGEWDDKTIDADVQMFSDAIRALIPVSE